MPDRQNLADQYDTALLDLDGVIYVGAHAVAHAESSLRSAKAHGMRLIYVTNNASRTPDQVAKHLVELGIGASAADVVTSAQAAAGLLAQRMPRGARVLVVGGEGLAEALRERALVPAWSLDEQPAAVVQGFNPDISWRMLAEGAYAVAGGLPWVASNMDSTIPTARGIAPGNGTLVAAVRTATGRNPEVAGKPEPPIFSEAVSRAGARRTLVIGDRLDTDIEGANNSGLDSLLVLTGIASVADVVLASRRQRPTYLGADLRSLLASSDDLAVAAGVTEHGGWSAQIVRGELRLCRTDTPGARRLIDAVRAACGAVWTDEDDGNDVDPESVDHALEQAARADEAIP